MKFKSLLIIVFFVVLVVAGFYSLVLPKLNKKTTNTVAIVDNLLGWKFPASIKFPEVGSVGGPIAYSDIRDPGGIPQGLPVRLKIPIIGVDSAIEDALITPDGRMDVPANSVNVAWFALGPHPGQVGSAVIGGHFGISNGVKFVFYDLDKLKIGDKAYIIDDRGDTLTFQVKRIELFDRNADATTVFTSTDGLAHLNIITCEGTWNQVNGLYSERRVVFTDLVKGDGIIPVNSVPVENGAIPTSSTFTRSLSVGLSGTDVTALQTILEQKGFLSMPAGVDKGFFGSLTRSAVAKYQTSRGISPIGVFGPTTKARLILELANSPVLPNAGVEKGATTSVLNNLPISLLNITQLIKNMFTTRVDSLITLLLLFGIIYMLFKIMKK